MCLQKLLDPSLEVGVLPRMPAPSSGSPGVIPVEAGIPRGGSGALHSCRLT